jgi:RNA polymerase sigma-70 factor (ECF subfamily)
MELAGTNPWTKLSPLAEEDRSALVWLVSHLRGGDQAVLARVIDELVPVVERLVSRLLGPRHDVPDAVQESLTEIAVALHDFEGRSSIQTLAHRITTRTTARFYRRAQRDHDADVDAYPHLAPSPEDDAGSRRDLARIYGHLETLSDVRRTAFVLCCIEGMDPAEAAEVAQCSANTIRSRLFEARAELVALLERDEARAARRRSR